MNILIADDHAIVRNGLIQTLSREFSPARFGEVGDGPAAIEQAQDDCWDVFLLDLNMPGANGLDVIRETKARRPNLPILVLSMHSEDQFGLRVLKAGAQGFLSKESAPEELMKAVRTVLSGRKYISPMLAEKLTEDKKAPGIEMLSDREFTVMRLLYEGHAVKEIAARLELSSKTISTYRQRILEKLNLRSNAELIQYITRNGLFG